MEHTAHTTYFYTKIRHQSLSLQSVFGFRKKQQKQKQKKTTTNMNTSFRTTQFRTNGKKNSCFSLIRSCSSDSTQFRHFSLMFQATFRFGVSDTTSKFSVFRFGVYFTIRNGNRAIIGWKSECNYCLPVGLYVRLFPSNISFDLLETIFLPLSLSLFWRFFLIR